VETEIGDVQLLLCEAAGAVPARFASDGTLRILAFGAALAAAPARPAHEGPEQLIVIEEIERGLYPAQARTLLESIVRELPERAASVLLTTHSAALLKALPPERHPDVIVCSRDPESGSSRLRQLTELPGYPELIAAGDSVRP
jgi:predicted ATPase